jgi:Fe-S-cluster containining protein
MFTLDADGQAVFRAAVRRFAHSPDVRAALDALYQRIADATELRRPVCVTSGRCCNFEKFGHRLFATTMEFAFFVGELDDLGSAPVLSAGQDSVPSDLSPLATCPFQAQKLCTVHRFRPFGCRVYFCDETSTDWQVAQYEAFQRLVRQAHGRLGVPYLYVEWTQGLKILGLEIDPVGKL